MKEIKAWAVVDKRGRLVWDADEFPLIKRVKRQAVESLNLQAYPGERVVRVTVRIEE